MNRDEARQIAQELWPLMRPLVREVIQQAVTQQTIVDNDEYLTTSEAAKYLRVSISYINRHLMDIPHTKCGGKNKFSRAALQRYIQR